MRQRTRSGGAGSWEESLKHDRYGQALKWFASSGPFNRAIIFSTRSGLVERGKISKGDIALVGKEHCTKEAGEAQGRINARVFEALSMTIGAEKKRSVIAKLEICLEGADGHPFAKFARAVVKRTPVVAFAEFTPVYGLETLNPELYAGMEKMAGAQGSLGYLVPGLEAGLCVLSKLKEGKGITGRDARGFWEFISTYPIDGDMIEDFLVRRKCGKAEWKPLVDNVKFAHLVLMMRQEPGEDSEVENDANRAVAMISPELIAKATAIARLHVWGKKNLMEIFIGEGLCLTGSMLDTLAASDDYAQVCRDMPAFIRVVAAGELQKAVEAAEKAGVFG